MKTFIEKIHLKNFKNFEDTEISPTKNFSMLIGENNKGKSSIFEAILLWKFCFDCYIVRKGNSFRKKPQITIPYKDLAFLRLSSDNDLFNDAHNDATIAITIKIETSTSTKTSNLSFKINTPTVINDSYIRVFAENPKEFEDFATTMKSEGKKLSDSIMVYQSKPIAKIDSNEIFLHQGAINARMLRGENNNILRNKIANTNSIQDLNEKISAILGEEIAIACPNKHNSAKDEHIKVEVVKNKSTQDLHLQGSGLIHSLEMLTTIMMPSSPVSIALIDEPDAHIHTNAQINLINTLRTSKNHQIFTISHNDKFINHAEDDEIIYIYTNPPHCVKLQPLKKATLDSVSVPMGGYTQSLYEINKAKLIVFTEGTSDIKNIKSLYEKIKTFSSHAAPRSVFFNQLRGKGRIVDKINTAKIAINQIAKNKKNITIYDKDFCTSALDSILKTKIKTDMCHSHHGYCFESSLLTNASIAKKIPHAIINKLCTMSVTTAENLINAEKTRRLNEIQNINSKDYEQLNICFNGQKNSDRPELADTTLNDKIIDTANENDISPLANKKYLAYFFNAICKNQTSSDNTIEDLIRITNPSQKIDDDYIANYLFDIYIQNIKSMQDVCDDHIEMIEKIYSI